MAEDIKPKRGSVIRRKRASSMKAKSSKSLLGAQRAESEPHNSADVSILVTEPSPEAPAVPPPLLRQHSESTVVQVLVHRESEEYNQEEEECEAPTIRVIGDSQDDGTDPVAEGSDNGGRERSWSELQFGSDDGSPQ